MPLPLPNITTISSNKPVFKSALHKTYASINIITTYMQAASANYNKHNSMHLFTQLCMNQLCRGICCSFVPNHHLFALLIPLFLCHYPLHHMFVLHSHQASTTCNITSCCQTSLQHTLLLLLFLCCSFGLITGIHACCCSFAINDNIAISKNTRRC